MDINTIENLLKEAEDTTYDNYEYAGLIDIYRYKDDDKPDNLYILRKEDDITYVTELPDVCIKYISRNPKSVKLLTVLKDFIVAANEYDDVRNYIFRAGMLYGMNTIFAILMVVFFVYNIYIGGNLVYIILFLSLAIIDTIYAIKIRNKIFKVKGFSR